MNITQTADNTQNTFARSQVNRIILTSILEPQVPQMIYRTLTHGKMNSYSPDGSILHADINLMHDLSDQSKKCVKWVSKFPILLNPG